MPLLNIPDLNPSYDLFYVYGAILGDGTIEKDGRYAIKLGVTSEVFADFFQQSLNKLGLRTHSWTQKQRNGSGELRNVHYAKVYSKRFFSWVCSSPTIPISQYVAFLRGFFEAEGCNALKGSGQVKFYNSDRSLLENVKRMIERLGYSVNIIEQEQKGFGSLLRHTLYLLGGKQAGIDFLKQLDPCIKGVDCS